MCRCIDWLVYSFEHSIDAITNDNKGGVRTRMLNSMMPLKEILRMCKEASEVCEPCREKE
jgi:hypothetical protein